MTIISVYQFIYAYKHTHTHIHFLKAPYLSWIIAVSIIHRYTFTHTHTYIYIYMIECLCVYIWKHIYKYIYICVCVCVCVYMCVPWFLRLLQIERSSKYMESFFHLLLSSAFSNAFGLSYLRCYCNNNKLTKSNSSSSLPFFMLILMRIPR